MFMHASLFFQKAPSKILFLGFLIISIFDVRSQTLNIGLNTGITSIQPLYFGTIGGNVEFRPKHAYFSINTDPFVLFNQTYATFTEPLYFKCIIGNKFRVCPSAGGFVRTSGNYGWLLGLHFEYTINQKLFLFSKKAKTASFMVLAALKTLCLHSLKPMRSINAHLCLLLLMD